MYKNIIIKGIKYQYILNVEFHQGQRKATIQTKDTAVPEFKVSYGSTFIPNKRKSNDLAFSTAAQMSDLDTSCGQINCVHELY